MRPLRDTMRREAGRIWREKARAEELGLFMNEETITETVLLQLAIGFQGKRLRVQPFTKTQETKNGADWEFWFLEGSKAVGLRVQAKRLYPSGKYNSLHPKGPQTHSLITQSRGSFPVFVFYNDKRSYPGNTPVCNCREYYGPSYIGCTVMPAYAVASLACNDAANLASHTIPWHCLLCDRHPKKHNNLPGTIARSLNKLLPEAIESDDDHNQRCEVIATPEPFQTFIGQMADIPPGPDDMYKEPDWLTTYLEARALAGVALITVRG